MSAVKVTFLYTEVAGYFLACAAELSKHAEVLIFRWPVNQEAPFELSKYQNLQILDRTEFNHTQLKDKLAEFAPSMIICSGWLDKGYTQVVKSFKKKIPTILSLDNHWTGSIKQKIAAAIAPFHLQKIFTHAWVPGPPQAHFAEKLGFKNANLLRNFYCADDALFDRQFQETFELKKRNFPKRFLYVARYVEHKGIFEMWNAFLQLKKEIPNDWELLCVGAGEEWENRVEGEGIKHVGFVQPEQLKQYVAKSAVYILPSKFEPWGVSVQEFAICGFPLLLSSAIGAKHTYLKEGKNGFEFEADSKEAIKKSMQKVIEMSIDELILMGEKSHEVGMSFTTVDWAKNLLSILK
jgi:glycosyltransferase involved in cell wall biosynthesis